MRDRQVRVLLVDDHRLVRDGLRLIINREPDMKVIGEANDGYEALVQTQDLQPDLILLDVEMPGCHGIDVVRMVRAKQPKVKIIVLTGHPAQEWIEEAVKAGISGSVMKTEASSELIQAIRLVMAGKAYLGPEVTSALLESCTTHFQATPEAFGSSLSERETEVIRRIAAGQSTKEIADALQLSTKTIEARRLQIMAKIGVSSVAELTKYAIRHGLTSLS